jgi:hypothetical protein
MKLLNNIELIDWSGHLFRCSGLSNITSTGRGVEITTKQREELSMLLDKIKLTEKQAEKRDYLSAKLNAKPELSKGAKTFLEGIWIEETFNRRKNFSNKYTEKGTEQETESMHLANGVLEWGLTDEYIDGVEFIKQRINNDFITGEPDLNVDAGLLADIKSSWDVHTFPHFKDDIEAAYYAQGQGYMWLTGKTSFELVYCLVDTPDRLILDAIRRAEWSEGFIEIPEEYEAEIRKSMTFEDIPAEARVKRYKFEADAEYIKKAKECVIMAREYLFELNEKGTKNNF